MYAGFSDELGIGSGGDAGEERDTDFDKVFVNIDLPCSSRSFI